MDRHTVDWRGYIPAVTTPFAEDGELDLDAWRGLLDWLHSERMHGIAVAGTTGEWFSLAPRERADLNRVKARRSAGPNHIRFRSVTMRWTIHFAGGVSALSSCRRPCARASASPSLP